MEAESLTNCKRYLAECEKEFRQKQWKLAELGEKIGQASKVLMTNAPLVKAQANMPRRRLHILDPHDPNEQMQAAYHQLRQYTKETIHINGRIDFLQREVRNMRRTVAEKEAVLRQQQA